VDATAMWGFILIGAGALVAGNVGIALPPSERLGAFLTLVIGAGVGVAALAVGTRNVSSQSNGETAFLVASALGFIAVVASAGILWMRASRSTLSSDQAALAAEPRGLALERGPPPGVPDDQYEQRALSDAQEPEVHTRFPDDGRDDRDDVQDR
jgi:hypothetical protein